MDKPAFLPLLRELARTYQAFESYSARHVRTMGLTSCQFDIIATLGNTPGMNFRELGERTLITKGTLTGVVDRLESRQLVRRVPDPDDGRSQIVQLTAAGETLFAEVFPAHIEYMSQAFASMEERELAGVRSALARLGRLFDPVEETAP